MITSKTYIYFRLNQKLKKKLFTEAKNFILKQHSNINILEEIRQTFFGKLSNIINFFKPLFTVKKKKKKHDSFLYTNYYVRGYTFTHLHKLKQKVNK